MRANRSAVNYRFLEPPGFSHGEVQFTYKGNLPLNTHGGQLSWGQPGLAGGMSHITEAARQLMGRADQRQVKDCQLALVNGNGGIMSEQCTLILGR